jgi:hypothetical protein
VCELIKRCIAKESIVKLTYRDGETYAYPQFGGHGGINWGLASLVEGRLICKRGTVLNPVAALFEARRLFDGTEPSFAEEDDEPAREVVQATVPPAIATRCEAITHGATRCKNHVAPGCGKLCGTHLGARQVDTIAA